MSHLHLLPCIDSPDLSKARHQALDPSRDGANPVDGYSNSQFARCHA